MTLRDVLHLFFRIFVGFFLGLGLFVVGMFFWAVPRGGEPLLQKILILSFAMVWIYGTVAFCLHHLLPQEFSNHESAFVPFGKHFRRHFFAVWILTALLMALLVFTWPNE